MNVYGDISPRTAAYAAKEMLTRALPLLVLEKFMQAKTLPANSSKTMTFRRYNSLAVNVTPLVEGVTPTSKKITHTDVTVTLDQLGDLVELTDVIADTHEDPILMEFSGIIGEQAAQSIETKRFNVLKAGTNKFYANGVAGRTSVVAAITAADQKKIIRALKRQNAMPITSIVKSTPSFNTESVLPSYVGIGHTDLENDIRAMTGFIDVKDYGQTKPMEGEIGAVGPVRYILSNIFTAYADGGGAAGSMVSTSGVSADVYPIIYMAKNAWAGVALKGAFAIHPTVINPSTVSKSDPLGQRGSIGWKTMQCAVILNDAWMAVAEVAATDL